MVAMSQLCSIAGMLLESPHVASHPLMTVQRRSKLMGLAKPWVFWVSNWDVYKCGFGPVRVLSFAAADGHTECHKPY